MVDCKPRDTEASNPSLCLCVNLYSLKNVIFMCLSPYLTAVPCLPIFHWPLIAEKLITNPFNNKPMSHFVLYQLSIVGNFLNQPIMKQTLI